MSFDISIPFPEWDSDLHQIILDLEKLRGRRLYGEVPPYIFFQLKHIFQYLETIGSARIEGNNTTLSEYVEKIIEGNANKDEKQQEIDNIEDAIKFVEEETDENTFIDRAYISELHKKITLKLMPPPNGEGSMYPGELRKKNVSIKKSKHIPPSVSVLQEYFDKFVEFINEPRPEQNQLLMVAIAHHEFMYIHPCDNGNGRMGRLLTYALLIKLGFNVKAGRIINPSAVFYTNRDKYYDMLAIADKREKSNLLEWSEYFLLGLKNQIEKIDSLLQMDFTREKILIPSLKIALDRKQITKDEFDILQLLVNSKDMAIKSAELSKIGVKDTAKKSYAMQKLRDKKMVMPIKPNGRIYTIRFSNSYLLRGIIQTLEENGFVADFLNNNGIR